MSIKNLSIADKDFFKKHLSEAKGLQEKEFLAEINKDTLKAYYRGLDQEQQKYFSQLVNIESPEFATINKFFPSTNRITPSLYWRNPKIYFRPMKKTSDFSAKILTSVINYIYREKNLKHENQMSILDAWYWGFSGCKIGYQTDIKYKEPKKNMGQKIKEAFRTPSKEEREIDYVEYEGPWARRISPFNILFDPYQSTGHDRIIWIKYEKTLDDILNSDLYEYDNDFAQKWNKKDAREVKIILWEGWVRTKDGLYIYTICDQYDKPLRWEKSSWLGDGFPLCFLQFANETDCKYPTSYLRVAQKPQRHLNYLTTLQMQAIKKFRNQIGYNANSITEGGHTTLQANEIGGMVEFKTTPVGQVTPIITAPIPKDLYAVGQMLTENLQECLQVSGLRLGSTEAEKTLGQDELKELGNQLGVSGIQDKVREFVKEQATKLSQMLKQFATAETIVPIVGLDIINPETGQLVIDEWLEFGTPQNPITLKEAIAGDYDVEVDIRSAQQPNQAVQLQLFEKMMSTLLQPEVQAQLQKFGKTIDFGKLIETWLSLHKEFIPNPDGFVKDIKQMPEQMQQEGNPEQELDIEGKELLNKNRKLDSVRKQQEIEQQEFKMMQEATPMPIRREGG